MKKLWKKTKYYFTNCCSFIYFNFIKKILNRFLEEDKKENNNISDFELLATTANTEQMEEILAEFNVKEENIIDWEEIIETEKRKLLEDEKMKQIVKK